MRRRGGARAAALALLVAGLAACGGGGGGGGGANEETLSTSPSPGAAPLVVPGTWTVIGSSTPAGVGATAGRGWVDLLRADYAARSVSVVNLAAPGGFSYQGLPGATPPTAGRPAPDPAHNIDAALARGPRLVLVSYPSNDTAAGYSADETVRNMLAIRAHALERGVPVMVTSTQPGRTAPSAQQAATLAQIDARLAAAVGACFVDVRAALSSAANTLDARFSSDGQHLNDAGHAVVFQRVKAVLDGGGCVRTS